MTARASVLALLAAALCAAPAAAFEKGSWMPATDMSVLGFPFAAPQVTVAPDGTMITIWGRSDGGNTVIQAATRSPGGALSDPIDLSDPARTARSPRVAIAADGTATAVWTISPGNDAVIEVSTRPPGGSFGPAVVVGTAQLFAAPDVVAAADGTTTVAWSSGETFGSLGIVRAATRPPGGTFGPPVDISAAGQVASNPLLAVATDGTTTAIWDRFDGTNQIVQAATRPPGGTFGAPIDLSASGANAQVADLELGPDGTATAIWTRGTLVQAATRPPGGAFALAVDLSRAGENAMQPHLAVAGDGTTTVVWRASNADSDSNVQAATRAPGGSFTTPLDLIAPVPHVGGPGEAYRFIYESQVAVAADGTTIALWTYPDGTAYRVQASTRLPGGTFGAPVYLSVPGFSATNPQAGMAADGFATVVWSLSDGISRGTVQAAFTADAPIGHGALTITGAPALGSTLSCDGGRWIGATSVDTRWLRGDAEVATGSSYSVATADEGSALVCRARAANALGSTQRLSAAVNIPAAIQAPAPAPAMPNTTTPPADRVAPSVAILTKARLTRRQFLKGVSVKLSTDEPATIVAELRGRASRSRTTGPYTRPLGSRTLRGVTNKAITIRIKPRPAAVGKARTFNVRLRLTVTDALGNRRITGQTIRVAG